MNHAAFFEVFVGMRRHVEAEAALPWWRHPIRRRRGRQALREMNTDLLVMHPDDLADLRSALQEPS